MLKTISKINRFLLPVISEILEHRTVVKIRNILRTCEKILEEKGYLHKKRYYYFDINTIDISIDNDCTENFDGFTNKNGHITRRFSVVKNLKDLHKNITDIWEASLELYCHICCLKPLKDSRYQQYQKEAFQLC